MDYKWDEQNGARQEGSQGWHVANNRDENWEYIELWILNKVQMQTKESIPRNSRETDHRLNLDPSLQAYKWKIEGNWFRLHSVPNPESLKLRRGRSIEMIFYVYMHICQVWRVQEVEKQTNQILKGDQRCEHHKTDIWGWEKKATVPTLSSHSSLHTRQNWLPVLVWPCHCPPLTLLVWPHQGDELTKQEYCLKTCFENYGKRTNNQLEYSNRRSRSRAQLKIDLC